MKRLQEKTIARWLTSLGFNQSSSTYFYFTHYGATKIECYLNSFPIGTDGLVFSGLVFTARWKDGCNVHINTFHSWPLSMKELPIMEKQIKRVYAELSAMEIN